MNYALSNEQMRNADQYTINALGVSSQTLMQRAGEKIFREVIFALQNLSNQSVLVVCGTGNNGGDGFVCAQLLKNSKVKVKVYAFSGNLSSDCAREKQNYSGKYADNIDGDYGIIVDCIFGTGICREVGEKHAEIIKKINKSPAFKISADIPSGINGDNGLALGVAVKADLTVAIAEYKLGHFLNDGKDYCGKIVKADIGISLPQNGYARVFDNADIKSILPKRKQNSNKGTYGLANIVAGSEIFPGAAALSVAAALKSGCGYVQLTCQSFLKKALFPIYPQAIYSKITNSSAEAIAIGMGCERSTALYETLKNLLTNYGGKLLIDADGINILSMAGAHILKEKRCEVLITPHIKEFSRLTKISVEKILSDPVKHAKDFAKEYGVTVLLKSSTSVITNGENTIINIKGSSALAKAGSGDMLSGLCCGILAQGKNLFEGAIISSYILGLSAELAEKENTAYATTSTEIIKNLANAFLCLTK
ncbi:MAG: NAD(P)H-hydrate dehydratase [Clostridiales bacterium]|nr:NAD(P)H-hydrate dehydratase [Clostridiales bacterium]